MYRLVKAEVIVSILVPQKTRDRVRAVGKKTMNLSGIPSPLPPTYLSLPPPRGFPSCTYCSPEVDRVKVLPPVGSETDGGHGGCLGSRPIDGSPSIEPI